MAKIGYTHSVGDGGGDSDFDLIPDGWYEAEIEKSENRETSSGNGSYLFLQLRLTDSNEKFGGRVVFERLNLDNPNETAVKIAKRSLDQILVACGLSEVDDSEELHGRPMLVKIRTRPARGDFDASNEVKGYRPVSAGKPKQKAGSAAGGSSWM